MLNKSSLHELADKIRHLLNEFDLEYDNFGISIQVHDDYYEQIKANFQEYDTSVGIVDSSQILDSEANGEKNKITWTIAIIHSTVPGLSILD